MRYLATIALLAMTACAPPLTGDALADCLAARNQTIQMQNGVSIAEGVLLAAVTAEASASTIARAQQAVTFAHSYLATAQAREATLCAPAPLF